MSKYKGLFTFDLDNHRYVPVGAADGIIDCMDYEPNSKPAEPLIKDEKIRKAVRAWAEANKIKPRDTIRFDALEHRLTWVNTAIEFNESEALLDLEELGYTIAELCGEEE